MIIVKLTEEQELDFIKLTQELHDDMFRKDLYCPIEGTFLSALQPGNHFSVGAYEGDELMGGFTVYFPTEEDSYSNYTDTKYDLDTVAHMENCAVVKKYRGKGLQAYLCQSCEQILKSDYPDRVNCLCTVHPKNRASLKNMVACDYKVIKKVEDLYGAYTRCILYKQLRGL